MSRPHVHPLVWGIVALLTVIQAVLALGDAGIIAPLRPVSYLLAVGAISPAAALNVPGAWPWFLAGLFGHMLLHAGWLHLAMNGAGLLCLGHVVQRQAGNIAFIAILLLSGLAGAVAFLILTDHALMIGASGAVFGLLGTVLRWRSRRVALWRVLVVLALLSLPAGFLVGTAVAWQAHFGGFLAGWVLGRVFPVRQRIVHPFM